MPTNEEAKKENRIDRIIEEIISGAENQDLIKGLTEAERKLYDRVLEELKRTDLTIPEGDRLLDEIERIVQSKRPGRRRIRVRSRLETR